MQLLSDCSNYREQLLICFFETQFHQSLHAGKANFGPEAAAGASVPSESTILVKRRFNRHH
jgi:hypothetical protein